MLQVQEAGTHQAHCPDWDKKRAVAMMAVVTSAVTSSDGLRRKATVAMATYALRADWGPGGVSSVGYRWIVDSGASHHMTGEGTALPNLGPCDPVHVELADGNKRVATKKGSAIIKGQGRHQGRGPDAE